VVEPDRVIVAQEEEQAERVGQVDVAELPRRVHRQEGVSGLERALELRVGVTIDPSAASSVTGAYPSASSPPGWGPGVILGVPAYATSGVVASSVTPAPWLSASSDTG
jgi:hypothetical protein